MKGKSLSFFFLQKKTEHSNYSKLRHIYILFILQKYCKTLVNNHLGTDGPTKTDEFSEKFQTAFDPPPSFSENHITIFPEFMTEVPFRMAKFCNINFWIGNDPPPLGIFQKIHPFWWGHPSLTVL